MSSAQQTSSAEVDRWIKDPVRGGAEGPLAPLLAAYNASLAFIGTRVRVITIEGEELVCGLFLGVDRVITIEGEELVCGLFLGVDGYGHALVSHDGGIVDTYDAVDVCIRPA